MINKEYILIEDKNNIVTGFLYDSKVRVLGFREYLGKESCYIEYKDKYGFLIDNGLVLKSNLKEVE